MSSETPDPRDSDDNGDRIADYLGRRDSDGDGIPDSEDQNDDSDGILDSEDEDADRDGIDDDEDPDRCTCCHFYRSYVRRCVEMEAK